MKLTNREQEVFNRLNEEDKLKIELFAFPIQL